MTVLRRATLGDVERVWQCREALRKSTAIRSARTDENFDAHVAWFSRTINDPARLFFIIEEETKWLGYLRFDPLTLSIGHRVSIALLNDARGAGIGGTALDLGCAHAERACFVPLYADISVSNPASRRIFEKCGFALLDSNVSSDGFQRFVRHPQPIPPSLTTP